MWFTEGQELGWRSSGDFSRLGKNWGERKGKEIGFGRNFLSPLVHHPWMYQTTSDKL